MVLDAPGPRLGALIGYVVLEGACLISAGLGRNRTSSRLPSLILASCTEALLLVALRLASH